MPPGHVAITWGMASLMQKNNEKLTGLDYRLLAFCALAPDIIDKPLALLVFTEAHTSQLIAHALLPHVLLLMAALLWWRPALPYVLAFNGHLLADRMWNHTESFWWPLFGWDAFWQFQFMNTPEAMVSVYWDIVTRYPQVWLVELLALWFLLLFGFRYGLYRRRRLAAFLRTGRVNEPLAATPTTRPAGIGSATAPQHPPSE
ncbi:MAG: hypothetical protein Kow0031_33960 [Anaerolineae bacterium]